MDYLKRKPSKKELIYIAGFFDGEGSIEINKHIFWKNAKNTVYTMSLSVNNIYKPVIESLYNLFGGSFYRRTLDKRLNRKPLWTWSVQSKKAENVLKLLLPYLYVKRRQAQIALEYRKTFSNKEWRPSLETLILRDKYAKEIKNERARIFT